MEAGTKQDAPDEVNACDDDRFSVEVDTERGVYYAWREVACLLFIADVVPGLVGSEGAQGHTAVLQPPGAVGSAATGIEPCVLMVSSRRKPNCWTLPKGGWEQREDLAARIEHEHACVLCTGNFLNAGTSHGNASGYTLENLSMLSFMKAVDGKTTLLDAVVQQIDGRGA